MKPEPTQTYKLEMYRGNVIARFYKDGKRLGIFTLIIPSHLKQKAEKMQAVFDEGDF